jgi:DNA-binding response OmpR family regulator
MLVQNHRRKKMPVENDQPAGTIGAFDFYPLRKMLKRGRKEIPLSNKETSILQFLLRGGDREVPRSELLEKVWGLSPDDATNTLTAHVYRLRRKIEKDPANAKILITVRGGYRLRP